MRTIETCGGDDSSYQVPLTTIVTFDGVEYSSVYATTNSVITFGRPDGTYWDYPQTPSISLYSMDWLVYPNYHQDEHLIIQTSDGGFRIDISARPIWLYGAELPTNIIITAAINADGTVAISYATDGPLYEDQTRTGVRLVDGTTTSLTRYGVVEVQEAVTLTVDRVVTQEATRSETVARTEEVARPVVNPPATEQQPTTIPEPTPGPLPVPEPTIAPVPDPELTSPETPVEEPSAPPVLEPVSPEPPVVEPEPKPILPQTEQEVVMELVAAAEADDPELPAELAAIPLLGEALGAALEVFNDIGNLGSDMTPEVREQAEKTVVASVIVGQVATSAAAAAATSASASTRKNK